MKRLVGFARVSSAEQEAKGFSLKAQQDNILGYAMRTNSVVARMFSIAESAKVAEFRTVFKGMLEFVCDPSNKITAIVFDRVDRAIRTIEDLAKLLALQKQHGFGYVFLDINLDTRTAPGEMVLTMMAGLASYSNRLSAERVIENMGKRARMGLPVGHASFGYENYRDGSRALVRIHTENGPKVRRIFYLVAVDGKSIAEVARILLKEGVKYTDRYPRFSLSKLNSIIHDRAYLGEVRYHGEWLPGAFEPLIDLKTFVRAQDRVARRKYLKHEMIFSHSLILCGHCNRAVTADPKTKTLKSGEQVTYTYYRCSGIAAEGHPKVRVREDVLDRQVRDIFRSLQFDDPAVRQWFVDRLLSRTRENQAAAAKHRESLRKELARVAGDKDRNLRAYIAGESEKDTYLRVQAEYVDREAKLLVQLEEKAEEQSAEGDLVVKVFGLSQDLAARWDAGGVSEKRLLLDIICSDWILEGETLVPRLRAAFLALRLASAGAKEKEGTPDRIRT